MTAVMSKNCLKEIYMLTWCNKVYFQ